MVTEANIRRIARYLELAAPFIAANYPEYLVRIEHGRKVQARAVCGPRKAKVVPIRTAQPSRAGGT